MTRIYPPAPVRTETQLRAEAERIRSHPNFDAVLLAYTRRFYALREVTPVIAKLIANEDRYRTLNFLYSVWAESMAHGGEGAFTYSNLFEICRRGEVTPRVLKTTLAVSTYAGFLDRSPHPQDARSWLYRPTRTMLDFPLSWLLPIAESLDTLLPGRQRAEALKNDQAILVHLYRSGGREFVAGVQPIAMMPEFMAFCGRREGGSVIAMGLFLAATDNVRPPSRQDISNRFGISKSQVAQVLAAGEEMGFLTLHNGVAIPTGALFEGHAAWTALSLAFLGHHLWPEDYVP